MQLLHIVKGNPFAKIDEMKKEVPIEEVALLGLCDRLGRGGTVDRQKEEENVRIFLTKCNKKLEQ